MTKTEELVQYVESLTEAQTEKLLEHLPLLKQLVDMTDNELIYSETFLEQYNKLYTASQSGQYSPAQIKAQLSILEAKRTAINALEADIFNFGVC